MTTRAEFLERIRAEMRKTTGLFPAKAAARPVRPADAVEIVRRQVGERLRETAERFRRELERVGGAFHRAGTLAEVPDILAAIAHERGASRLVAWHPSAVGADLTAALTARGLAVDAAAAEAGDAERARLRAASADADLGLTGVDAAIAETGTLVLRSGPGRPRSTSLLPPTHVALLDPTVLVESLAQLGVFLEAWHQQAAPPERRADAPGGRADAPGGRADAPGGRADALMDGAGDAGGATITLITGPSRTADIELTLTRGVHGPKEVHVVLVEVPFRG
jgi:L-lactate dehydrogenase complex protein LldG